jgi:hypothetical protein
VQNKQTKKRANMPAKRKRKEAMLPSQLNDQFQSLQMEHFAVLLLCKVYDKIY